MAAQMKFPLPLLLAVTVAHIIRTTVATELLNSVSHSAYGHDSGLRSTSIPSSATRKQPLRVAEVLSLQNQNPASYGGSVGGTSSKAHSRKARNPNKGILVAPPKFASNNQLQYFQGPIIVTSAPVHIIYYGDWRKSGAKTQAALKNFLNSIMASSPSRPGSVASWWKINNLLSQKNGKRTTTQVYLGSQNWDWYSQGRRFQSDTEQVFKVVKQQLDLGKIKHTPGAMYVVLTSADVRVGGESTGFCAVYCGWHDYRQYTAPGSLARQDIYYAFVGDPSTQCPAACGMSQPTPSGSADAIIDTFAHEIAEIATDPDAMTGWLTDQDSWGQENADICRRVYQDQKKGVSRGLQYNYNLEGVNGARFLVQANYNPVKAQCSMSP